MPPQRKGQFRRPRAPNPGRGPDMGRGNVPEVLSPIIIPADPTPPPEPVIIPEPILESSLIASFTPELWIGDRGRPNR